MQLRFETAISAVLATAGMLFATAFAYRTFVGHRVGIEKDELQVPEYVDKWRQIAAAGIRVGPHKAKVNIVEFGDIECPFCKTFHASVRALQTKYPESVSLVFVHFPLTQHRFAIPAARAVECADNSGRFAQLLDILFGNQDSIGLKPWGSYALEAGVSDTVKFIECLSSPHFARIAAGLDAGKSLGVRGTPTVLLNGWRMPHAPSGAELDSITREILAGRSDLRPDRRDESFAPL